MARGEDGVFDVTDSVHLNNVYTYAVVISANGLKSGVFANASPSSAPDIFNVRSDDGSDGLKFELTSTSGDYWTEVSNTQGGTWANSWSRTGSIGETEDAHAFAVTFDRINKTVEIYADGVRIASVQDIGFWTNTLTKLESEVDSEYIKVYEYNGSVTEGDITVDAIMLPEPTALALLVLGVAGLALRRRAA